MRDTRDDGDFEVIFCAVCDGGFECSRASADFGVSMVRGVRGVAQRARRFWRVFAFVFVSFVRGGERGTENERV